MTDAVVDERDVSFLEHGGKDIAYRASHLPGAEAGLFWLSGFHSVMSGGKATHLAKWASVQGHDFCAFDYSGHGLSGGPAFEGTISDWLDEAVAVYRAAARVPQVLIGSSMGGWLALLLARRLEQGDVPISGIVLIAPAWDMTERLMWSRFTPEIRDEIMRNGVWNRPSRYDDGPYPISRALIEDGQQHCLARYTGRTDGLGPVALDHLPVRIVHGKQDPDVPWEGSVALIDYLGTEDVQLTLIKDGEHRLSRPGDLAVLERLVAECAG